MKLLSIVGLLIVLLGAAEVSAPKVGRWLKTSRLLCLTVLFFCDRRLNATVLPAQIAWQDAAIGIHGMR